MHVMRCMGCAGALEQECWAAVAVHHDSQHLVDDWAVRAAQIKAASSKKGQPTTNGIGSPAGKHVVYCCILLLLPTSVSAERVIWQCLKALKLKVWMDRQTDIGCRRGSPLGTTLAQ